MVLCSTGTGRCVVAQRTKLMQARSSRNRSSSRDGRGQGARHWRREGGDRRFCGHAVQQAESPLLQQYPMQYHSPVWEGVESEAQFFGVLQKVVEVAKAPPSLLPLWRDFYASYHSAVTGSRAPGADERLVAQVQASIADCALHQFVEPYTFPSFHERILAPYNYYDFGQRYVGSLVDFQRSLLGHPERWATIEAQLAAGDNVVLVANHQSEADPGVFAHMLVSRHPGLAHDVIYVAGDRVVTDPLCKPFSMGRNLFCVHSRKRLDDVPELKASKIETNRRTLATMQRKLKAGGILVWIAPAGGRDRPGKDDTWAPSSWEPSAVELMRNLLARSKRPGHMYPMTMFSWPVMPPPADLEKEVGEKRINNFSPVGISVCEELDVKASAGSGDEASQREMLTSVAFEAVAGEYKNLVRAINDSRFRESMPQYVEP